MKAAEYKQRIKELKAKLLGLLATTKEQQHGYDVAGYLVGKAKCEGRIDAIHNIYQHLTIYFPCDPDKEQL